jgi:phenylpropionate dioxygenase-like ring-hydroxylating dioxygenase large terminal subunit
MKADEAESVLERLRTHQREGTKDLGERVAVLAYAHYSDARAFEAEQRSIFRRLPLLVGHVSQLEHPGDFITVGFTGTPLLIVRDARGEVRAFVNACRHRGALIEPESRGQRSSLICPYHGWRYELDGALANVTARECFPGLDTAEFALVRLPLEVVEGLIFVIVTPGLAIDARGSLGPVADHLAGFELAGHRHFRTELIETRFNWKIGVEGSLETYHFRYLHARTVASLFGGMGTIYDHFPPHQRQCVAKPGLGSATHAAGPLALLREQVLMTYLLFPCSLISVTNDHMLLTSFFPRGVGSCTMVYTLLTPAERSTSQLEEHWERTWRLTRAVLAEDFAVQEGIQRAAEGGYDRPLVLGRFEQGIERFRAAITRLTSAETDAGNCG